MSQSTVDDDDLFGEAAAEIRDDVEDHLASARAELPDAKAIWETDADNVLGALNGLRTALEIGDAEEHLRQAKKWYTMGERADAFEDAEDLAASIEETEELIESLREASERVGELTSTLPELRGALQEARAATDADQDAGTDGGVEPAEEATASDGGKREADDGEGDADADADLDEFEDEEDADADETEASGDGDDEEDEE